MYSSDIIMAKSHEILIGNWLISSEIRIAREFFTPLTNFFPSPTSLEKISFVIFIILDEKKKRTIQGLWEKHYYKNSKIKNLR